MEQFGFCQILTVFLTYYIKLNTILQLKNIIFLIKHKDVSEGLSFTTCSLFKTTFKDLMFILEIRIQLRGNSTIRKKIDLTISIESQPKKVYVVVVVVAELSLSLSSSGAELALFSANPTTPTHPGEFFLSLS